MSGSGPTENQVSFIKDLLDKLGYRGSPLKEEYLRILLDDYCTSPKSTSDVIDFLLEQLALRRNMRPNDKKGSTIAISDLADYAFCPASYAIRRTFRVPPSIEMLAGTRRHEGRELESFLFNVKRKREREFESKEGIEAKSKDFVFRGDYGVLLRSRIVFRGHEEDDRIFYSPDGEISGVPDYIFERPDSTRFVVEEKHTAQGDITRPWINHIVQVLGYVKLLSSLQADTGYIVYFRHFWEEGERRSPLLFRVRDSSRNNEWLEKTLEHLRKFRENRSQSFDKTKVRPTKCIGCSVNAFCNHKSGLLGRLKLPYRLFRTARLP